MSADESNSIPPRVSAAAMPAGLNNAYWFSAFNALSFQIVLGSPMVLYAGSLQASATILGIIAGMMPLLVILQIPAANFVDRVGYKQFVFAGWGIRVVFIFIVAIVPWLTPFVDSISRLGLILALLFAFNVSRGISSSAWLPWITALIPHAQRGTYLALDAACVQFGSFLTLLIAALCLGISPGPGRFSLVFLISGLAGAISLSFLKRIPDAPIPEHVRTSRTPVPYGAMIRHPPFFKLLAEVLVCSVAYGGMTTFTVAFLKTLPGYDDRTILLLTSSGFLGGLGSLWLGKHMDRLGSKPLLMASFALWVALALGWAGVASRWFSPSLSLVFSLQFFMGLLAALANMANTRLAMVLIPEMGRSHFFAIYSVVLNVTLGLAPIGWGLFLDLLRPLDVLWHGWHWNRFSAFFVAVAVAYLATLWTSRKLEEPQAGRMEDLLREILIKSPQRFWLRLWPRS